jgi:hypothetical protein
MAVGEVPRRVSDVSIWMACAVVAAGLSAAAVFEVVAGAMSTVGYTGTSFGDHLLLTGYATRGAVLMAVGAVLAAFVAAREDDHPALGYAVLASALCAAVVAALQLYIALRALTVHVGANGVSAATARFTGSELSGWARASAVFEPLVYAVIGLTALALARMYWLRRSATPGANEPAI